MEMLKEGILGIGETDETENEEGSEIELTAYNPNFDEPQLTDEEKLQIESEEETPRIDLFSSAPLNELTDGVTTLFMKKGGRVPFQGGGRDASQADFGGGTSGGNVGGGNGGGRPTMADIAGPTTTTPTTAPDTGGHSRFEPGSGYYGEPVTDKGERGDTTIETISTFYDDEVGRKTPLERVKTMNTDRREKYNKAKNIHALNQIKNVITGNIFGTLQREYKFQKNVVEPYVADLKADIERYKNLGIPSYSPHTDTLVQTLEQEILDITQPRSKDEEDTKSEPQVPSIAPVTEEIEDSYAQATGFLQGYRDLKARQALSAQLQQKWADEREWQQNTMFANRGGLANLFRVKN